MIQRIITGQGKENKRLQNIQLKMEYIGPQTPSSGSGIIVEEEAERMNKRLQGNGNGCGHSRVCAHMNLQCLCHHTQDLGKPNPVVQIPEQWKELGVTFPA